MSSQEQMTVQQAMSEIATAEGLADAFALVFEKPELAFEVFSPDCSFELNLSGRRLVEIAGDGVRIEVLRTVPTLSGFVTEHEVLRSVDGIQRTARRLWLCEVRDGRIAEAVGYEA
jgi:hypothetical protein